MKWIDPPEPGTDGKRATRFAFMPERMDDTGETVWLEWIWYQRFVAPSGHYCWLYTQNTDWAPSIEHIEDMAYHQMW